MLRERSLGSQIVGFRSGNATVAGRAAVRLKLATNLGSAVSPSPDQDGGVPFTAPLIRNFGTQQGIFCPAKPSHLSHPMSQPMTPPLRTVTTLSSAKCGVNHCAPLLNQKHAWPLEPVSCRGSAVCAEGDSHQLGVSAQRTATRCQQL